MKTNDLIVALAADTKPQMPQRQALGYALAGAVLAAGCLFFVLLGPRPDFTSAIHTLRFDFKFVVTATLAICAYAGLRRAMRPETGSRSHLFLLFIAPVIVLVAVVAELLVVPSALWATRWIGQNWLYCMTFIPVLSLAPLALLIVVLRRGATTTPSRTGALAGLLAGAIGAVFYAAHCPDDSPLFVASWYTIAIGFMTGVGSVAGTRFLRW
jgi:hypothetical protein